MIPLIFSKFGIWSLGTLDVISLIAATTNAFNGRFSHGDPITTSISPSPAS
jgi:hypothetical protein